MKISGFTIIKNAVLFQYPVAEAIGSILPLCDEVVVAVGDCSDGTRELVAAIDSQKIKIIDTVWNRDLKEGGRVLAIETDKAFKAVSADSDWCIYIQGDEVLHESGYPEIVDAMTRWKDVKNVDGLLFKYLHFYGSFNYTGAASNWYRNEIRIIKNDRNIYSYRDAQSFRKGVNEKLNVKPLNAFIHHYGWVREPKAMQAKQNNFGMYYQNFGVPEEGKIFTGDFDYSGIDALNKFSGTHPAIMHERIKKANWSFEHDLSHNKMKPKEIFKNLVEKITGKRPFDFNNYKII